MDSKGQKSKLLLANILKNANEENYNAMIAFISTEQGFADFSFTIRSNHTLSLIFLKNYLQSWINSKSLEFLYNFNFITFLIECCANNQIKLGNLVQVADYMEILSNNYLIPMEIISTLINLKMFILVDAIFKKYTTQQRSDRLFTEINTTIPMFFPVFVQMFFDPAILNEVDLEYKKVLESAKNVALNCEILSSNCNLIHPKVNSKITMEQEFILSIFYSLVFQDIHPFFEDNADHFFKIFFILFDQNQLIINQIFDLFVTKYPEIANFQLIILTLSRFDSLDGLVVSTLTKAYSSSRYFPNVILNFLQRNLNIQMNDDWLSNTQNFIKGNDIQRGFTHKLIRLLNCNVYSFKDEPLFFVATILKYKDADLVNKALSIVNNQVISNSIDLIFSAFAYLLTVHEFGSCSVKYLETDLKFICMKYLSNSIKSKDTFHLLKIMKMMNSGVIAHSDSLETVNVTSPLFYLDSQELFKKIINILQINYDEFSSDLLFRLVKSDKNLLTNQLYDLLTNIFINIHKISSLSLNFLFEIYILLGISLKKYNLSLIETILTQEIFDIYNLCFYYMSIAIQETDFKESFILYILSQKALWDTKELHGGLSCILISAFKKEIVKLEQIKRIVGSVDGFNKVFILNRAGIELENNEFTPEENYLINGIFDSNWFIENFLNKKYLRMIIKKMLATREMQATGVPLEIIQRIVEKNKVNIEYENYPHSISMYFDI